MPIWLRNFTFRKMQEHYEKSQAVQKEENAALGPDIQPSYSTRVSK